MKKLLLFGGTTEGRELAMALASLPVDVDICVATDYGKQALADVPGRFTIHVRRMEAGEMARLMERGKFGLVVDATHPYAQLVSQNIRAAAHGANVPCLRLLRPGSAGEDWHFCTSVKDAASALAQTKGNALLTTGAKELSAFTAVPGYQRRLYPRVLPTAESVGRCEELGFAKSHIIAMQGPFSYKMNVAMMEQFAIQWLVTKDGGAAGGFWEKVEAAAAVGAKVLVIGRPAEEEGLAMEQVLEQITGWLEEDK